MALFHFETAFLSAVPFVEHFELTPISASVDQIPVPPAYSKVPPLNSF